MKRSLVFTWTGIILDFELFGQEADKQIIFLDFHCSQSISLGDISIVIVYYQGN